MANRYWVGGTGTWDAVNVLNWSLTSGGVGGAPVPTAADIAIFNASSGVGTVTLAADATVFSMTFSGSSITTFDWNNHKINLAGNAATLYVGNAAVAMLNNPTINATYSGSTGTRTITGGVGIAESNAVNVNITAGTDTVALGTGNNTYKNVNFTGFSGTLAAGNRRLYGGIIYSAAMTVAASSGGLIFAATSGTHTITAANQEVDGLMTFSGGASFEFTNAVRLTAARTLTVSAGSVKFRDGATSSAGAFMFTGTSSSQIIIGSTTPGAQFTLSDPSGTNTAAYTTISDSIATGGATWNAFTTNGNIDAGNNLGWDFSTQIGKYIYTVRKNKRILP